MEILGKKKLHHQFQIKDIQNLQQLSYKNMTIIFEEYESCLSDSEFSSIKNHRGILDNCCVFWEFFGSFLIIKKNGELMYLKNSPKVIAVVNP